MHKQANMRVLIVTIALAAAAASCTAVKKTQISEFKEITKDISTDNAEAVRLAQFLYLEMVKNK